MKLTAIILSGLLASSPDGGTPATRDWPVEVAACDLPDGGRLPGAGWKLSPERMSKVGSRLRDLERENSALLEKNEQLTAELTRPVERPGSFGSGALVLSLVVGVALGGFVVYALVGHNK